jgi:hypothetical protein
LASGRKELRDTCAIYHQPEMATQHTVRGGMDMRRSEHILGRSYTHEVCLTRTAVMKLQHITRM